MVAGMPWVKPKYLVEDTDRFGNLRTYVRAPGQKKIRIRPEKGTPEFWEAYGLALKGIQYQPKAVPAPIVRAKTGSLRWLCEAYFEQCAEFRRLDIDTRTVRRRVLNNCWDEKIAPGDELMFGDCPIKEFGPKFVKILRDRKIDAPEAANSRLKALRSVFKWALGDEDIMRAYPMPANPARDVPAFRTGSQGFHTWTLEEVERFEATHRVGSTARLALALLMFTGQRKSDVIAFGRQHVREEIDQETGLPTLWIHFTQNKNRNRKPVILDLPVLPELQASIKQGPSGNLTFLVNEYGKPFSAAGFGNRMRKWCNAAGLKHCSAHGLRKAGACIAAENGATEKQLMAIFGWSDPDMAAHYTKKARQKQVAGDAMHLIVRKTEKSGTL